MIKEVNLDDKNFNTSWNGQCPVENYRMGQKAGNFYRIKNKEQERAK